LREKRSEFAALKVRLACVVQGTAAEAARFCGRHGLADACIADPEKESYRAMGFPRGKWSALLFPDDGLKRRRAEASAAGCRVSIPGAMQSHSDWLQLPGAALIERSGRIAWLHRGTNVADLPSAAELLAILQRHM
jgi:hypothetical protein